jgi:predicted GIY-YIG superfamily endonuclease
MAKDKQYIYIVQSSKENTSCKTGITNDLKRRLKEYKSISTENIS